MMMRNLCRVAGLLFCVDMLKINQYDTLKDTPAKRSNKQRIEWLDRRTVQRQRDSLTQTT
jgi:hypothetical protein